jgi:addiction module HigA family antidote
VLREDFVDPLELAQGQVAELLDVDRKTINELMNDKRTVTPEMAIRLGHWTRTSPEYWMRLQLAVNLCDAMHSPILAEVERLPVIAETPLPAEVS